MRSQLQFYTIYLLVFLQGGNLSGLLHAYFYSNYGIDLAFLPLLSTLFTFIIGIYILIQRKYSIWQDRKYFVPFYVATSLYIIYMFYYTYINDMNLHNYMGQSSPVQHFYMVLNRIGIFSLFLLYLFTEKMNHNKMLIYLFVTLILNQILFMGSTGLNVGMESDGYIADDIEGTGGALVVGFSAGFSLVLLPLVLKIVKSNSLLKITILVFTIVLSGYVIAICGKRGPILWSLVTILLYLIIQRASTKIKFLSAISISVIAFFIYTCWDYIIIAIGLINPTLMNQIMATLIDNQISGRDSIYEVAIKQIETSPFLGSYYCIDNGYFGGVYPHNILLEVLMTFGFIAGIPLLYLFLKCFIYSFRMLKCNSPVAWASLFFIYHFLSGMSTGALYHPNLWYGMLMVLAFYKKENMNAKTNTQM